MRIKFEKGCTPEMVCDSLFKIIEREQLIIGSVNIYIQTYDEEMQPNSFMEDKHGSYTLFSPSQASINEYENQVVEIRRSRLKVIQPQNVISDSNEQSIQNG